MRPFSKQEIQAEPAFLFLAVSGHVVVVVLALVLVLILHSNPWLQRSPWSQKVYYTSLCNTETAAIVLYSTVA